MQVKEFVGTLEDIKTITNPLNKLNKYENNRSNTKKKIDSSL